MDGDGNLIVAGYTKSSLQGTNAGDNDAVLMKYTSNGWVAVKELKLNYYIGETLLITFYTHYGLSSLTATQQRRW